MNWWVDIMIRDDFIQVLTSDALSALKTIPSGTVQAVNISPVLSVASVSNICFLAGRLGR